MSVVVMIVMTKLLRVYNNDFAETLISLLFMHARVKADADNCRCQVFWGENVFRVSVFGEMFFFSNPLLSSDIQYVS